MRLKSKKIYRIILYIYFMAVVGAEYKLTGLFKNVEECQLGAEGGIGNNQTNPACNGVIKKEYKSRNYIFTLNNWTVEQKAEIIKFLKKCAKYYIIGEEIGELGTPHLQGYMSFQNERYYKGICEDCEPFKKMWSRSAKANVYHNFNYCSKQNHYITNIDIQKWIKQQKGKLIDLSGIILKKENFYDWQNTFHDIIFNCNSNRYIHWICDKQGKKGKTEFLKYMTHNHGAIFTTGGKKNDIMNLAINNRDYFEYEKIENEKKFVIFNFPKDTDPDAISYNSMEMFLDGLICNNKFESNSILIKPVKVIVLANCEPNINKLIKDRWNIYDITADFKLINYQVTATLKCCFNVFKKLWLMKKFSDPEIINEPIKETKEPFIEKPLRLTKKSLKKILDNHNSQ
jgi:hypothetical protein